MKLRLIVNASIYIIDAGDETIETISNAIKTFSNESFELEAVGDDYIIDPDVSEYVINSIVRLKFERTLIKDLLDAITNEKNLKSFTIESTTNLDVLFKDNDMIELVDVNDNVIASYQIHDEYGDSNINITVNKVLSILDDLGYNNFTILEG